MWISYLLISTFISLSLSMAAALVLRNNNNFTYTLVIGSLPIAFYTGIAIFLQHRMNGMDLFTLVGLVALAEATIGWRLSLWINPSFKAMTADLDDLTDSKSNLHPLAVLIMIAFYEMIVWLSCWISSL